MSLQDDFSTFTSSRLIHYQWNGLLSAIIRENVNSILFSNSWDNCLNEPSSRFFQGMATREECLPSCVLTFLGCQCGLIGDWQLMKYSRCQKCSTSPFNQSEQKPGWTYNIILRQGKLWEKFDTCPSQSCKWNFQDWLKRVSNFS